MTKARDTSQPAFPNAVQQDFKYAEPGMSLRDYFAGQALVALIDRRFSVNSSGHGAAAVNAYAYADAMLRERERTK